MLKYHSFQFQASVVHYGQKDKGESHEQQGQNLDRRDAEEPGMDGGTVGRPPAPGTIPLFQRTAGAGLAVSGGERFIISLALALGISRLAEKNAQIDSLFLDEGFGTLDEETLEKAIAALIKISEKGKMIGIITHVEMLQGDDSPIETKIRVKPHGTTGHSVVEGPGVTCDPADAGKPGRKPRKKKVK